MSQAKSRTTLKNKRGKPATRAQGPTHTQLEMKGTKGWGGKRRGAGRPNKSGTVSHARRESVDFKRPLNLTLSVRKGLPNMRQRGILNLLQSCVRKAKRFDFHVLHFSLQSNHIHLIAEAKNNEALARGMQSLASNFAKKLKVLMQSWKKAVSWTGSIFVGRYHLRTIVNPTQMKNTLKYVLLNGPKHSGLLEHFDEYSSCRTFTAWKKLLGRDFRLLIALQSGDRARAPEEFGLSPPRSWLAREGWMKAA